MKTLCLSLTTTVLLTLASVVSGQESIIIGNDPGQFDIGWSEGVCYQPISNTRSGDTLVFEFGGHDVYKMASVEHFYACDFSDAILLASPAESSFEYTITDGDGVDGTIYFACSIGAHCSSGNQKLKVAVNAWVDIGRTTPVSTFVLGSTPESCTAIHQELGSENEALADNGSLSECTEPVLQDDGRLFVSCLSGPATMTPGGVINNLFMLHYPYPRERRVMVGQRTWEFVQDVPGNPAADPIPVPVNQLYIHHLSGSIILGQGAEGIRRSAPDAPFPPPNGLMTGDEGDLMIFHIIDLREVVDWLPCIECRCTDGNGTYLDAGGGVDGGDGVITTGGVSCCFNCTDLVGPTVDYRMRYNVSFSDLSDGDEPINEMLMLTADISPVVGKNIEFDVPEWKRLPEYTQKQDDPFIQRLVREGPFRDIFKHDFFGADYHGPDPVKLFRCVGHLHVAAIGMWLEDAETGEMLCNGDGVYGTNPDTDKGFLTAIVVDNYDDPKVFPADRMVRLVTEYNATDFHTGVMGMLFLFISGERDLVAGDTALLVDVCSQPSCDVTQLPRMMLGDVEVCEDALPTSPACRFAGICDCGLLVSLPGSSGCGGVFSTDQGDIEIDSVCAKHCDKCEGVCEDALPTSPACRFANLCECSVLIESAGCGSVFPTDFGDIEIDSVCAKHCDKCEDISPDELFEEAFLEELEVQLAEACKYSTEECHGMLSNLYSCAQERSGVDALAPVVRRATVQHGQRLALKHAKLGDPSMHRNAEEQPVQECSGSEANVQSTSGSARSLAALSFVALCIGMPLFLY